jgi:hypothetical protein
MGAPGAGIIVVMPDCFTCNGYLVHPFEKETPWAFTARFYFQVRWDSAIKRGGEWFSCRGENRRVWAADHQGRHAQTVGESCKRPLEA